MSKGVGDHTKDIIREWLRIKTSGCGGCEELLQKMNKWGPAECRKRIHEIVPTIQKNAKRNKKWRMIILSRLPGIKLPIYGIVLLAIARAEMEAEEEALKAEEAKHGTGTHIPAPGS